MKISRWMKLLAVVLVVAMMFQMLPIQALALDGSGSVTYQEYESDAEDPYSLTVLGEVESLREEKIKHFRLSDGSFVAVSYGMPVHYQDSDGQWQDIDNSLMLGADSLETANESAPAAFSRDLADGEIFTASQGDFSVSMSLLDSADAVDMSSERANVRAGNRMQAGASAAANRSENRVYDRDVEAVITDEVPTMLQLQEKYVWDVNDVIPEKLQASLVYQDVFPGIDLLYTAFGYNIKEQIVVNEPQNSYRFDFLLETNGLSAVLNSDGSVSFLDANGEAHYEIPAPYMVDAIGVYSDQVSFTLSEDVRGYVLTVEADKEWINAEDREFPVNIDPTLAVISGQALQDIYSVYTMEAAPNDTTLGRQWLYVGAQPYSTSNDGRYRIYMHFQNMPSIPSGSEVVHADLSLYKTAYTQRYCPQFPIGAYEVTTSLPSSYTSYYDWFSKMTWRRDQPSYDTTNAIDFAFGKTGQEYLHWNLTELVKKWYIEGTDNTTIALAMMNEDEIDTYYYYASATFYAYAGSIPPILTVSYRNNTGIEPYYTYRTMGAGEAGTAYVADATGQLKIAKELVSYASNTNPFSLNLVYNSDYFSGSSADYNPLSQLGLSMSVGSGWTLDCVQKITAETISGVSYLKYADGDGTIHYFSKDSSRDAAYYYDEDGLGLKIKNTGTNAYTMSDDKGNEWFFTGSFLTSTKDSDGNVFNINYSNGKITSITQVNNGQYTLTMASFTYSGNTLTSVTDKAGNVYTLTYSGTKLTGVQRGTTKLAEYLYDGGDSRVTRMADSESGYGIDFTYGTGKLSGYKEVAWETSAQSTAFHYGQAFSITYPAHSETVYRDSGEDRISGNADDLITHYLFDYTGRTVNAYTTDNDGNILGASNAVYTNNSGTDRKNNRTERTATIGIAGQQLLKNPGVETSDNAWITSTGISVSTEKPRTGTKGIKGTATEATNQYAYHSTEALVAGKTYTFSCFVNTSAITSFVESGLFAWVFDGQGNQYIGQRLRYATAPSIDGGWVRISVSFTPKVSGVHYCSVYNDKAIGTFYADDFQLEEGEVPSTFNLVENGSMEMTSHGWTMGTKVFMPRLEQMYINPQAAGEGEAWDYYKQLAQGAGLSGKFQQWQTYDNMACQQGKGTDLARSRIKELLHRAYLKYGSDFYILQCDVKGYYKNMRHEAVNTSFERRLPPEIYKRTEAVLETQYEGDTGYNPGSQMVQIAGISFLDKFDHFVKETLRMKEYMRYMDDFFMVAQTKEELEEVLPKINSYLNALGLSTHPTKTKIFHQNKKMRVLGFDFHVTKTGKVIMQIDPKNVKDRRKNIYRCAQLVRKGEMTREKADEMFRAWLNHASKGDNPKMIKRMHEYYQQCMEG